MKSPIVQFLVTTFNLSSTKSNEVIREGFVYLGVITDVRIGVTVLTPHGLGEIRFLVPDWTKTKKKIYTHAEVMLYRGYIKRYSILELQQYTVCEKSSFKFIKLSPQHYRYIIPNEKNQLVKFRVTKRNYAQLTSQCMAEYAYARTLNKQRGGPAFLRYLSNNNLKIQKII
jgi:hypothetical protein